jgi:hypothetical protein
MAKRGRSVTFHGAFGTKKRAEAKERTRRGATILKVKIRRQTRWLVITAN